MSESILVATRKGLFDLRRKGVTGSWEVARTSFRAENVSMVTRDPRDGTIYAALSLGHFGSKLHRSSDDGGSWEEVAVPAYPEGELIRQHLMDPASPMVQATLEMIWSIAPGGADQPGRLWAGTLPGGLFRSDDRGSSWSLVRSLWDAPERKKWFGGGYDQPGIHSVLVDPRDSRAVTLGVSSGGVWKTTNDGENWELVGQGLEADYMPPEDKGNLINQDPHLIAMCRSNPDVMWIQHHNGIFRSTDGGRNWARIHNVKPSVFGFAVASHPLDERTAWFVPAEKDESRIPVDGKVVVTRTRDGGSTFQVLSKGLPQQNAFDLTYRHCLSVDVSGERLAFGSTTGSLWLSDDGGDSWNTFSNHLPPIYAVKFDSAA